MLHHVSLPVKNIHLSGQFYDAALSALGYQVVVSGKSYRGYGLQQNKDKLLLMQVDTVLAHGKGFHIALAAPNRAAVDAFHAAAIDTGGKDNGAPGPRPHYGTHYYAAFVIDPDGHHLEAVINTAPD